MKRTTVSLPDDLVQAAEREARRRSTSLSDVTRSALAAYLGLGQGRRPLPIADLGRSGMHDTARQIDELISQEWRPS